MPTPWTSPYDAVADKNGYAWTGSMKTDRVARLDIKSGQYTEYPLPRPTNIRRVFVDDSRIPAHFGSATITALRSSKSSRSTKRCVFPGESQDDVSLLSARSLSVFPNNEANLTLEDNSIGQCTTSCFTASGEQGLLFPSASARSLKRWILPVAVFGSSVRNSSQRGYL